MKRGIEINIDNLQSLMKDGRTIDEVAEKIDWKQFESIVAEIFISNFFRIKKNFMFKTKKRFEIDLIAVKDHLAFSVDCKHWRKGRNKKFGLRAAATKQKVRVEELMKFLKKNLVAKKMMKIEDQNIIPLIVSLHEEDILKEGETLFVPVWKLNSFLLEAEKYI